MVDKIKEMDEMSWDSVDSKHSETEDPGDLSICLNGIKITVFL